MQKNILILATMALSIVGFIGLGCVPSKTEVETRPAETTELVNQQILEASTLPDALTDLSRNLDEHPEKIGEIIVRYRQETDPKTLATLGRVIAGYRDADGSKLVRDELKKIVGNDGNPTRRAAARELLAQLDSSAASK